MTEPYCPWVNYYTAIGGNVSSSAAARLQPDCDQPLRLWGAVKARQHSLPLGMTSTKHIHDDTCQTQASTQCLLWRLKRFSCACKYELFQFCTLSYLVENNCPKSGVQGHQISSFESLQLQLHFCGSFYVQALNSCSAGWRSGDLLGHWMVPGVCTLL